MVPKSKKVSSIYSLVQFKKEPKNMAETKRGKQSGGEKEIGAKVNDLSLSDLILNL